MLFKQRPLRSFCFSVYKYPLVLSWSYFVFIPESFDVTLCPRSWDVETPNANIMQHELLELYSLELYIQQPIALSNIVFKLFFDLSSITQKTMKLLVTSIAKQMWLINSVIKELLSWFSPQIYHRSTEIKMKKSSKLHWTCELGVLGKYWLVIYSLNFVNTELKTFALVR